MTNIVLTLPYNWFLGSRSTSLLEGKILAEYYYIPAIQLKKKYGNCVPEEEGEG